MVLVKLEGRAVSTRLGSTRAAGPEEQVSPLMISVLFQI